MKKIFLLVLMLVFFSCSVHYNKLVSEPQKSISQTSVSDNFNSLKTSSQNPDIQEDEYSLEKDVTISPDEIEQLEENKVTPKANKNKEEKLVKKKEDLPYNLVLEIKETEYTELYFKYYAETRKKTFQKWLDRANSYLPYILRVFREYDLPDDLAFLPFSESGFNPFAYSRAGAAGIWQFMPATARKYGLTVNWWIDERLDPYKSTIAAAKYLKDLYEMFGDWYLALAAYNAGEGKIKKALKKSDSDDFFRVSKYRYLKEETKRYVPKFMAILKIIKNLNALGFNDFNINEDNIPVRLFVREGTDLYLLAKSLGMSWKRFKKLNPHFRRYVTPPGVLSQIYVPKNLEAKATKILKSKKIRPYGGLLKYTIKRGDSWWRISRRYGVPISVLKNINKTRSNLLRPGRAILIPKTKAYLASKRLHTKKQKVALRIKKYNYIVKGGDSLWRISKRFHVPIKTILVANNLKKRSILRPGMKLYIPKLNPQDVQHAKRTLKEILYEVKKGDNIWNIAKKFGVSPSKLYSWNNLHKNSKIYPGDKLKILIED